MAEAGVERQGTAGAQEGKLQPGLKRRHMTMMRLSEEAAGIVCP